MHIVCSQCGTINRIPKDKPVCDAMCGKCKQNVYNSKPVVLDDHDFYRFIEKTELPILVDFWADWCAPCKAMAPTFTAVAGESEDVIFAKVDTQIAEKVSAQANIRSIPTLIFFYKGKEIDRVSGALNNAQMKKFIMQCIGKL